MNKFAATEPRESRDLAIVLLHLKSGRNTKHRSPLNPDPEILSHPKISVLIALAWFVIAMAILAQKRIVDSTFAATVVLWLAVCIPAGTAWRHRKR